MVSSDLLDTHKLRPNIIWYGIELNKSKGKNNGTINKHKIFYYARKILVYLFNQKVLKLLIKKIMHCIKKI